MSNSQLNSFLKYIKNGEGVYMFLAKIGLKNKDSDENFIKHMFKANFGYKLDLSHPKTFNEKTQWLKLYDRKPIYSKMVDKFEAKDYCSSIIGEAHIIPTIAVWERYEDIQFDSLPEKFVLKCTHDSGGVVVCKDKKNLDLTMCKKKITKSFKNKYYLQNREWPYKNITPRIIAENYLSLQDGSIAPEFKIFCFNGVAKLILVCQGEAHGEGRTNTFFDRDFSIIPVDTVYKRFSGNIEKPLYFEEMIVNAEKLSKGMCFLRVDFYCLEKDYYVGELTFYHNGGLCPFDPKRYDLEFGELINIPDNIGDE